jgi:Mrp family chromosome partitioning ATPase
VTRIQDAVHLIKKEGAQPGAAKPSAEARPARRAVPAADDSAARGDAPPAPKEDEVVAKDESAARLAEQLRSIKRPILKNADVANPARIERGNIIMLASASPGEGKTFISLNLARSIAVDQDREVVLIDGDFKKPQLSEIFGLEKRPGLLDVLAGTASFADAIYQTSGRFAVMPAGAYRDTANELLAHARTAQLFEQYFVAHPQRIALIDSSPLLFASEPHALAALAGQVVLVVRAGTTVQGMLGEAITKIGNRPCNVVLNDANAVPFASQSSYGYYTYGYGAQSGKDAKRR